MAVTVTVNLSDALKAELSQPGVFGYAVYFTTTTVAGDTPHWATLSDGSGTVTQTQQITLPFPYDAGKVYFVVQSQAGTTPTIGPDAGNSQIQVEGDLNFGNAGTNDFRFDSFELTVKGNSFDVANLTEVNAFGIPMSISNGLGAMRGYNESGAQMFQDIQNVSAPGTQDYTYTAGPLNGDQRMMAAPADATVPNFSNPPFSKSDWNGYVAALENNAAASQVEISGWFNGAPDAGTATSGPVWHDAGYYAYQLSWDGTYFWLNPLPSSQIHGSLRISPDALSNSIYATYGTADVFTSQGGSLFLKDMAVGANNQWGAVFRDFFTGFTGGYYGATGASPHGVAHGANIDLSNTANWDPTYAFGNNSTNALANHTYDKYALQFFNDTNAYGSGYSDNLMKALSVGPLMSLWNGTGNTPLTVNLFADGDTPSSARLNGHLFNPGDPANQMGYGGAPQMNNFIAPTGADYVNLTGANATFTGNNFSIVLGSSNVVADENVTVTFGMYEGGGAFQAVTLPLVNGSVYNTYTLNSNFTLSPVTSPQVPGTINITGLPVATDGSASWYQITIGNGTVSKTFNLYANSDPSSHQFYNPSAAGQADQVQIDGLGTVAGASNPAPQFVGALSVSFLGGSGFALDPSLLEQLTDQKTITDPGNATFVPPYAPVIGSLSGGVFSDFMATPGSYTAGPTPNAYTQSHGVTNPDSIYAITDAYGHSVNLVTYALADTVVKGKIAFGWWGADSQWVQTNFATHGANDVQTVLNHADADTIFNPADHNTDGSRWNPVNIGTDGYVLKDYTNKIGATNVAQIEFIGSDQSGTYASHAPITATADIDGNWTSKNMLFLPGTYKAVLQEFAATDTTFLHPLNKDSDGVVFNVNPSAAGGSLSGSHSIQFNPASPGADGAWVKLDTAGSTLPDGTLFVYFTDGTGALLDRNDAVTTSLQDAVRAEIGLVKTDGGGLMFSGEQSVYLPVGMQMKFAIQIGNGDIKPMPDIEVSGSNTLSVSVADPSGTFHLTAAIDNAPGANANLALSQEDFDHAWVHLTQGDTVHIDVAGSAYNLDTVHLLRIDVDPADPANSAGWKVGGVAWGDTAAFHAAVQANLDPSYVASGGRGDFHDSKNFTASKSGYYAPVLTTENGDTFVIGASANTDGRNHVRVYGQNTFGFEDLKASQNSDWDYNDLVMKITSHA
jgi:hypothetical protein